MIDGIERKRKVLIITPFSPSGTFYDWMRTLLDSQRKDSSIDLRILALDECLPVPFRYMKHYRKPTPMSAMEEQRLSVWVIRHRVTVFPLGIGKKELAPMYARTGLKAVLKRWPNWEPDLVHVHWIFPYGIIAQQLAKHYSCPYMITAHGGVLTAKDGISESDIKKRDMVLGICGMAKKITCVGRSLFHVLNNIGVSQDKIRVIYNGVDVEKIAEVVETQRTRLDEQIRIVSVGNLIHLKGHDLTLQATAKIIATYPRIVLDIVGHGRLEHQLRSMVEKLGLSKNVVFHGRCSFEKTIEIISRGDIFCLPSRMEGFGLVYAEALACGKPVIATKDRGISYLIEEWGAGILVEPDSSDSVSAALEWLIQHPVDAKEMGRRGQKEVVSEFSWRHAAHEYNEMYRSLTEGEENGE